MMEAIQRAHYVDGRRVVQDQVLTGLAGDLGLDAVAFASALREGAVDQHIQQTRLLMDKHGLHGFPAFLVQHGDTFTRFSHESLYGQPDAFVAALMNEHRA